MFIILFIFLSVFFFVCLPARLFLFSILKAIPNLFVDIFLYFKHKKRLYAPVGFIYAFTGLFGYGKTLSMVHYALNYYHKYNNVVVYDTFRKKYVRQYVNILSNVKLNIPYTPFVSLEQIVSISDSVSKFNEENDCRLVTLVLGDEFSSQLNSRNFRSNLDALTMNSLLTCRHNGISLIYTSQRFGMVDALLRSVTLRVYDCHKLWRLQCQNVYDAWDLENAGSPTRVKPVHRGGFFVQNSDYSAYDSLAIVENLVKSYRAGDLLSSSEILQSLGDTSLNDDNAHLKRRFRKRKQSIN